MLVLQIQLPPAAEAAATSDSEQLPPGLLPKSDAALPGLPDSAPAELAPAELAPDEHAAPAEHAVASPTLAIQIPRSISTGLIQQSLAQGQPEVVALDCCLS